MAGQVPDPRILNSWEDAFQHPLPVVRKLEQQLRKNIDDNRQKLRSLVGASYRDLLGTAERIIEMDEQMQEVDLYLGNIGRKCNARTVERVSDNHVRMRTAKDTEDGGLYRSLAQTKVLQSALTMVTRIIKAGGDALQASKLLVLSRLLHKSISESPQAPSITDELRRRLGTLRKKLLAFVERTMVRPIVDKTLLAHSLSAYALVTSSTPKEVLRHFLQVRYEQLDNRSDSLSEVLVLQTLDLYSQTLLDTRELFPKRFADALSDLAKVPLLQDSQVWSVYELNLDIYGTWIAEDVRTFTPWVRHDQLTSSEVTSALESWTRQAEDCLSQGLEAFLGIQNDARVIVESRREVLSKYVSLSSKLRKHGRARAIHGLRHVFLARLEELAVQCANINDLALNASHLSNGSDSTQQQMWDLATQNLDLGQGASQLRRSILKRGHGRNKSVQRSIENLDDWMKRVTDFLDIIDEMRSTRWDDDLDFDLDDLEDSEPLQNTLSKSDPQQLHEKLRKATQSALAQVVRRLTSVDVPTEQAPFKIRVWREVDRRRHALESRLNLGANKVSLVSLHRNIAESTNKGLVEDYISSVSKRSFVPTTLWDGAPPLPIQPSLATFKLLTSLHRAMSDAGTDLWSQRCVYELKSHVLGELADHLNSRGFGKIAGETLTNGHMENSDDHNDIENKAVSEIDGSISSDKDRLIQNLFDVHYLQRTFSRPSDDQSGLDSLARDMCTRLDLDDASNNRLKKNANEYWKRTYLLFGLLASSGGAGKE